MRRTEYLILLFPGSGSLVCAARRLSLLDMLEYGILLRKSPAALSTGARWWRPVGTCIVGCARSRHQLSLGGVSGTFFLRLCGLAWFGLHSGFHVGHGIQRR